MDRLKQIESRYNASLEVSELDFDWLIEQAKKVEQLKELAFDLGKENEMFRKRNEVIMENSVVRSETIEKYEKALRFYANKENYELWNEAEKANLTEFVNNLDMDKGETARKALGE